jgi:DNA (cytosine-5)-methyltransferase 1
MFKVIDLFCGTGGFSKGFENTGQFEVVHGIDILPIATETFRANHPDAFVVAGDIRKVRRAAVSEATGLKRGDVDVIIGGPPCQGFSSIRPFRSSTDDDPRNSLFEEFASYVNFFRPKVLVLENVVGLATYEHGATIDRIVETFQSLGYDCDWRIVNAANFGVPQRRERLILLGVERGGVIDFPKITHATSSKTIGHKNIERMHGRIASGATLLDVDGLASLPPAVTVREAIDDLPVVHNGGSANRYSKPARTAFQVARRENAGEELTLHSSTRHTDKMMEIIRHSGDNINSIPKHLITSGFSSCYSRLRGDEPAVTITVNFVHPASNKCIHPDLDRALTPREGARLQSYDDDFVFKGTRAQIVKQIGNAVPPLLGKAIAGSVLSSLGQPALVAV